jgi:sortase (surface protein transpeptidase)
MKASFLIAFGLIFSLAFAATEELTSLPIPLPPDTSLPQREIIPEATTTPETIPDTSAIARIPLLPVPHQEDNRPVRLNIPSIKLDALIEYMGVNEKEELDVPDGKTNNVGWYKDGTIPGDIGSAVFDAHVFAAFAKLKYLKIGDDIYVTTKENTELHFVVVAAKTYPLQSVPANLLFERQDAKRLNLITCAGQLTPDHTTYDHRLIIYTKLVE